jgi:hypothetical protein
MPACGPDRAMRPGPGHRPSPLDLAIWTEARPAPLPSARWWVRSTPFEDGRSASVPAAPRPGGRPERTGGRPAPGGSTSAAPWPGRGTRRAAAPGRRRSRAWPGRTRGPGVGSTTSTQTHPAGAGSKPGRQRRRTRTLGSTIAARSPDGVAEVRARPEPSGSEVMAFAPDSPQWSSGTTTDERGHDSESRPSTPTGSTDRRRPRRRRVP